MYGNVEKIRSWFAGLGVVSDVEVDAKSLIVLLQKRNSARVSACVAGLRMRMRQSADSVLAREDVEVASRKGKRDAKPSPMTSPPIPHPSAQCTDLGHASQGVVDLISAKQHSSRTCPVLGSAAQASSAVGVSKPSNS